MLGWRFRALLNSLTMTSEQSAMELSLELIPTKLAELTDEVQFK